MIHYNIQNKNAITTILIVIVNILIFSLQNIDIKYNKNLILKKGYNVEYGVRFLRRAIQNMIENPISEILLKNDLLSGETLVVKSINNKIKISVKSQLPIIT